MFTGKQSVIKDLDKALTELNVENRERSAHIY